MTRRRRYTSATHRGSPTCSGVFEDQGFLPDLQRVRWARKSQNVAREGHHPLTSVEVRGWKVEGLRDESSGQPTRSVTPRNHHRRADWTSGTTSQGSEQESRVAEARASPHRPHRPHLYLPGCPSVRMEQPFTAPSVMLARVPSKVGKPPRSPAPPASTPSSGEDGRSSERMAMTAPRRSCGD